jgi:hypothetical protein
LWSVLEHLSHEIDSFIVLKRSIIVSKNGECERNQTDP